MEKIKTLNGIQHLKSCGYGRPWPRHGLQLLHWFCHEYVTVDDDGDLMASENPKEEKYGFHSFDNRLEYDNRPLLPDQTHRLYYEVGNLNLTTPGAEDLPRNIRRNYEQQSTSDLSNMDRIIISLSSDWIVDKIYVTQHKDKSSFDRQNTFRISKGLVKIIQNLTLDGLLSQVGYKTEITPSGVQESPAHSNNRVPFKLDQVKMHSENPYSRMSSDASGDEDRDGQCCCIIL